MKENIRFPGRLDLLNLPTPTEKVGRTKGFWIKRDDLTGVPYGGNKPRKLEFLLFDAKKTGAKTIVTTGAIGSNHCLATTVYGIREGFDVHVILFPQPETDVVKHNFDTMKRLGAKMTVGRDYSEFEDLKNRLLADVETPYFIPAGGSCGLGCMGFVKAGLELTNQIEAGDLPEPKTVFCAAGTLGTLAGLALGFHVGDLNVSLRGIRVVDDVVTNEGNLADLISESGAILQALNPGLGVPDINDMDVTIEEGYYGDGYGVSTVESIAAAEWMCQQGVVKVDPTYTSKTVAAVLHHLAQENSCGETLYWHTFDSGVNLC